MEYNELKSLSLKECNEKLIAEEEQLRRLRFVHAISPIENPRHIKQSRKRIAQLKTLKRAIDIGKVQSSHVEK